MFSEEKLMARVQFCPTQRYKVIRSHNLSESVQSCGNASAYNLYA